MRVDSMSIFDVVIRCASLHMTAVQALELGHVVMSLVLSELGFLDPDLGSVIWTS